MPALNLSTALSLLTLQAISEHLCGRFEQTKQIPALVCHIINWFVFILFVHL